MKRFLAVVGMVLVVILLVEHDNKPSTQTPTKKITATTSLEAISWSEAPPTLFEDKTTASWAKALEGSAAYYDKISSATMFHFGKVTVSARTMAKACRDLAGVARKEDPQQLRHYLQKQFQLYRSVGSNGQGEVLVTAYYEPLLHGSLTRSERYFQPLYRRPPDLLTARLGLWSSEWKGKKLVGRVVGKTLRPYYDRAEIDAHLVSGKTSGTKKGKLADKELELAWVDNAIDAFFLHIQGSGRVALDTPMESGETTLRLGYASSNGRPYRSIGKILINEGKIPRAELTMPRLRTWLRNHPKEVQRILFANPSYVFFRQLKGDPVGNIQVPLSKERSIATDHRLFPKGAPSILVTTAPRFAKDGKTILDWKPDIRFTVNQDTGGAIRGAGRVDLFLGFGEEAENWAGVMKQPNSRLYFLAPLAPLAP